MRHLGPLIGAIDQGTSSTRFLVFVAETGELVTYHQIEIKRVFPCEGWVEQDPLELFDSVCETIEVVIQKLDSLDINYKDIKCIGLTNQRESALVWDKVTGLPLYNCIVWLDNRTSEIVDTILDNIPGRDLNWLKKKTGLPLSTYFTAFKLKWLLHNDRTIFESIKNNRLLVGTVDSWLLWKLTGQHMTDVTNASRTLLMDIETLEWDPSLCHFFDIPMKILPEIKSSSDDFGAIKLGPLEGIPITGVIGDQNAALVGQKCFGIGQAKVTYGTGCFLIQNLGPGPIHGALNGVSSEAKKNLITTVAYKLGSNPACYALEGSVAIAGAAITWLRDNLEIIQNYSEIEGIANQDVSAGGLFFVPALQGLYAPYWDANATGTIIGVSQFSRKCHLVRATLEGVAFQANDILAMMRQDRNGIKVDGGMSCNDLLCQMLADISGCQIVRPKLTEATALGAAMVAGYHVGLWDIREPDETDLHLTIANQGIMGHITRRLSFNKESTTNNISKKFDIFWPKLDEQTRLDRINIWKMAVNRSRKWIRVEKQEQKLINYKRLSALPFMFYVLMSFGTHILSVTNGFQTFI
ncbi:glycerol kinase-like [Oppia nitens]|uniref:glycerol kinase-like n=1 Tax=Oppia nitens TaxID=1686743 RepID=UPI0023DAA076|nr:glycerol kinase-like [Oppia nitens]